MSTLRISDAPLLPDVDGTEKIPTGGRGDYAISVDQIKDHIFEDVGKELVGLGNVDNTSDLDKPVSTAQQVALNLKADKTYVDNNLDLKADKTNVYTRSETTLALSQKADLVGGVIPSNQLPSYVDDVVEYTTSTLPMVGESGKIYITTDTNRTWRWSGNQYVEISNGGISDSTLKLQTARKIANVDFDGTQNIDIPHNNLTNRDAAGAHLASAIVDASGIPQQDINDAQKEINRKGIGNYDPLISYVEDSLVIKDGLLQKYTGGVWRPKDPTYYDFGAKIDGVTDDTAAFIAYHTVFKKAQLPVGTMVLSSMDLDQFMTGQTLGLEIEGAGTEVSVIAFTGVGNGFYSGGNRFFRDFRLSNLTLANRGTANTKVGFYIGSGGAEQVVLKSVGYNRWKVGRATHCWNSSMEDEIFRYCGIPFAQYGTSTNISNPYAIVCDSAYHFGYSCTIDGVESVATLPYAYSQLSGFAADHVGAVGNSVYKFGNVSGLTLDSLGTEDARGTHVFDFSEMSNAEIGVIEINNFAMYVQTSSSLNPNLVGICLKPPTNTRSQVVFNNPMISTEKQIYFISGDGSGVALNNPKMSTRAFTMLSQNSTSGMLIDNVAYGKDAVDMGEIGVALSSNSVMYSRLKNLRGKALLDPTTQKLVLFCGSLSEGLAQGLMMSAIITAQPLNKNGSNANEKAGQILISSAMDYNASNMAGHLKTVLTGTLTTATTVTRNMTNTTHIQFDVAIEASAATTRMMLDIDLTHNGIGNTNSMSWAIVNK